MAYRWGHERGVKKYTAEVIKELREMKKTRTYKQMEQETGIRTSTLNKLFNEV